MCTVVFYKLFYVYLFCLHYVYTSHINRVLEVFKQAWNLHPLSFEGNLSHCMSALGHRMCMNQCL